MTETPSTDEMRARKKEIDWRLLAELVDPDAWKLREQWIKANPGLSMLASDRARIDASIDAANRINAAICEHALASREDQRAAQAEPVAWQYVRPGDDVFFYTDANDERHDPASGWTETPLYDRPQPDPARDEAIRAEEAERCARIVEAHAREHEELAASEEDPDYAQRSLVYAKHLRRAAYTIRNGFDLSEIEEPGDDWLPVDPHAVKCRSCGSVVQPIRALGPAPSAKVEDDGWRTMESAPKDGTRIMLWWQSHKDPSIGWWEYDEYWDERPRLGWKSPYEGFRNEGDQCIPVNQHNCTHWRPLPAPPAPRNGEA